MVTDTTIHIDKQRVMQLNGQHQQLMERFDNGKLDRVRRDDNEVGIPNDWLLFHGWIPSPSTTDTNRATTHDIATVAFAVLIIAALGGAAWL